MNDEISFSPSSCVPVIAISTVQSLISVSASVVMPYVFVPTQPLQARMWRDLDAYKIPGQIINFLLLPEKQKIY